MCTFRACAVSMAKYDIKAIKIAVQIAKDGPGTEGLYM